MESKAGLEVFHILKRIGKHMLDNRATGLEALTYLTFLCFRGAREGNVEATTGSSLDDAVKTIDSLTHFTKSDSVAEDLQVLEDAFAYSSFCREDYIDAFHMLLKEEPLDVDIHKNYFTGTTFKDCSVLYLILDLFPFEQKSTVLDLHPEYIPFFYSFDAFQHYVMLERDSIRRSFFLLRKELEGASWNHVDIIGDFPQEESFDFVLTFSNQFTLAKDKQRRIRNYDFPYFNKALKTIRLVENAQVLLGIDFSALTDKSFLNHLDNLNGYYLEKVVQLTFSLKLSPGDNSFLILKKGSAQNSPVTFSSLCQLKKADLNKEDLLAAFQLNEGPFTTTVPHDEIREGTLSPEFYLARREIRRQEGRVSLSEIALSDEIELWFGPIDNQEIVLTVSSFENDPRLVALTPHKEYASLLLGSNILTKSAILIYSLEDQPSFLQRTPHLTYAGRIDIEQGSRIFIPSFMIPVVIDQERFDIRFVQMTILQQIADFEKLGRFFDKDSAAILDLLFVPDIPIEEQRKAVEDYLQGIRDGLPAFVKNDGSKDVTYNILVVTPSMDDFDRRFGKQLEQARLNIVGHAADSLSLKESIPRHFGKDIPVSRRVDAVLADITSPDGDTDFLLYRLHDLDVRKFYYSGNGDPLGRIHPMFREEILSGLIDGDNPAHEMRCVLDTQMSPAAKIREEYKEFFQAASRLDQLYPDWRLVDTVTGFLLTGKTKTPVNNVRSLLSETLCRFFRNSNVVPWCMDDGAIPSFLADGSYYDKNSRLQFKVSDDTDGKTLKSEAWLRYAFVTLFKLGNKESHVSKETKEMVSEAALIILMQVIIWFESVHDRYAEGKVGFKCFRKDRECDLKTVREVSPGYFAVGDVHIGNQDGLRDGTVGILDEQLPLEKTPRTINGVTFVRYADKGRFHIVII